ncbi:hypothetical protein Lfu02_69290 [Longispora fulva]|nr:hypothetical protein Lfu02_69290 [Longispora fulva]
MAVPAAAALLDQRGTSVLKLASTRGRTLLVPRQVLSYFDRPFARLVVTTTSSGTSSPSRSIIGPAIPTTESRTRIVRAVWPPLQSLTEVNGGLTPTSHTDSSSIGVGFLRFPHPLR